MNDAPERNGAAPHPVPARDNGANAPDIPSEPLLERVERQFTADGIDWIAYISGRGAYGTGLWGLAALQAVHFVRAGAGDIPELEALLPAGRFGNLYDSELVALLRVARRIVIPEAGAATAARRISLEEDQS
jgi:hypothetical protein